MDKRYKSCEILEKWFPSEKITFGKRMRVSAKCTDLSKKCQCQTLSKWSLFSRDYFSTKKNNEGYYQVDGDPRVYLLQCFAPYEGEEFANYIIDLLIHKMEEQDQIIRKLTQELDNLKKEIYYMPGNDGYLVAKKEFDSLNSLKSKVY